MCNLGLWEKEEDNIFMLAIKLRLRDIEQILQHDPLIEWVGFGVHMVSKKLWVGQYRIVDFIPVSKISYIPANYSLEIIFLLALMLFHVSGTFIFMLSNIVNL